MFFFLRKKKKVYLISIIELIFELVKQSFDPYVIKLNH